MEDLFFLSDKYSNDEIKGQINKALINEDYTFYILTPQDRFTQLKPAPSKYYQLSFVQLEQLKAAFSKDSPAKILIREKVERKKFDTNDFLAREKARSMRQKGIVNQPQRILKRGNVVSPSKLVTIVPELIKEIYYSDLIGVKFTGEASGNGEKKPTNPAYAQTETIEERDARLLKRGVELGLTQFDVTKSLKKINLAKIHSVIEVEERNKSKITEASLKYIVQLKKIKNEIKILRK